MNCKPGDLAYIKRPWMIASDIGRPVTVIRRGRLGEVIKMRDGGEAICTGRGGPSVVSWLCEANDAGFPCFIADYCLIPNRPEEESSVGEQTYEVAE